MKFGKLGFILAISFWILPTCAREPTDSDLDFSTKTGRTHSQLKLSTTNCLSKLQQILDLAPEWFSGTAARKQAQKKVESILLDIHGLENCLFMSRLLILTRNHFRDGLFQKHTDGKFTKAQSETESLCDDAIYQCAWSIANHNESGASIALAIIKKEWRPDGMNSLLFHRCELRQQHKPDDWL